MIIFYSLRLKRWLVFHQWFRLAILEGYWCAQFAARVNQCTQTSQRSKFSKHFQPFRHLFFTSNALKWCLLIVDCFKVYQKCKFSIGRKNSIQIDLFDLSLGDSQTKWHEKLQPCLCMIRDCRLQYFHFIKKCSFHCREKDSHIGRENYMRFWCLKSKEHDFGMM